MLVAEGGGGEAMGALAASQACESEPGTDRRLSEEREVLTMKERAGLGVAGQVATGTLPKCGCTGQDPRTRCVEAGPAASILAKPQASQSCVCWRVWAGSRDQATFSGGERVWVMNGC